MGPKSRREFLATILSGPALFLWTRYGRAAAEPAQILEPTPACGDAGEVTVAQTAGPFFKPNSPERRTLLEPGMQGVRIIVEGLVRSTSCKPVAGALLDFWQADAHGAYDNSGYRLRGHQFTDKEGRYRLETVIPGLYPGRTRHFHVRVQAPNRPVLTTQLYFPHEQANKADWIFNPKLVLSVGDSKAGKTGRFDFVVALG